LDARSRQEWDAARESALRVISILAVVQAVPDRPAQYLVKTWVSVRDCLWNIAAKPQIYGDPFMWTVLYEANRHQIDDPDLILPGMILEIPSIAGEVRFGLMEEDD
jgi:nucleoid-associated protein YgaU